MTGTESGFVKEMNGAQNQESPRRQLRSLVKRGTVPKRSLFVPIAQTVAAQIDGYDVQSFLTNATRLAKGLTSLHEILLTDGIVCFVSAGAEAEALGAELEWDEYPPRISNVSAIQIPHDLTELLKNNTRIETSVDVIKRLSVTAKGEPLFAVVITGPATLASQLEPGKVTSELLEACGRLAGEMTRVFGEAGAHIIMIAEGVSINAINDDAFAGWQEALTTVINVARFFQALPVLLPIGLTANDNEKLHSSILTNLLICFDYQTSIQNNRLTGVMLDRHVTDWQPPNHPVSLLTTSGEIPSNFEISQLRNATLRLRDKLMNSPNLIGQSGTNRNDNH